MSRAPWSMLRTLRNARGYTQASMAERSGLAWDTVRRLESGSYSPSLTSLIKLASGLRLRLSTLFLAYETADRPPSKELRDFAESLTPWELDLALKLLTVLVEAVREVNLEREAPAQERREARCLKVITRD